MKMKLKVKMILLAIMLGAGVSSTSHASLITITTDFSFSDFQGFSNNTNPAPVSTVSGSVTLTFDPFIEVTDVAVDSISFDDPSSPFATSGIRFSNELKVFSGLVNFALDIYSTDFAVQFQTNDFLLRFAGLPSVGTPGAGQLLVTLLNDPSGYTSNNGILTTTIAPPTVPEPAPFLILALSLFALFLSSKNLSGRNQNNC